MSERLKRILSRTEAKKKKEDQSANGDEASSNTSQREETKTQDGADRSQSSLSKARAEDVDVSNYAATTAAGSSSKQNKYQKVLRNGLEHNFYQ